MTLDDVLAHLQRDVSRAGTAKAWASAHGFTPSYVGDVLQQNRPPGPRILAALGIEKVVIYRRLKTPAAQGAMQPDSTPRA